MNFGEVSKPVNEEVNSGTARAHNAASGRAAENDWVVNADKGPDTVLSEATLKEQAEAKAEQAAKDAEASRAEAEAVEVEAELASLQEAAEKAQADYMAANMASSREITKWKILKKMIADTTSTPEDITKFTADLRALPNDEEMAVKIKGITEKKAAWDEAQLALKRAQTRAEFVAVSKDAAKAA